MYIVVVGAGRAGMSVARWLVSAGHEIAVIDRDRTRCSVVDDALGGVSVHGDGANADILAKAGASRAEVLIATTGSDDVNLAACQLAKHRFEVARTTSVVNSRDHSELFELLGIDTIVDVTELVLGRIQEGLASHGLVHLMPVSDRDDTKLVRVKIPLDSGSRPRPIKDISLPGDSLISLVITRDGRAWLPGDDTLIRGGDEVVAVTTAEEEEELRTLLTEEAGE